MFPSSTSKSFALERVRRSCELLLGSLGCQSTKLLIRHCQLALRERRRRRSWSKSIQCSREPPLNWSTLSVPSLKQRTMRQTKRSSAVPFWDLFTCELFCSTGVQILITVQLWLGYDQKEVYDPFADGWAITAQEGSPGKHRLG
jgi:hypothetical protein